MKPPSARIATCGTHWASAVSVLTRNSPPTLLPEASKTCAWMSYRTAFTTSPGSSCQVMMKPPFGSAATSGRDWRLVVRVLTKVSAPIFAPAASNSCIFTSPGAVVVVGPGDDEAAARQRGDGGDVLRGRDRGVDEELAADLVAVGREDLRDDAVIVAVMRAGGRFRPHRDEAARGKGGEVGVELSAVGVVLSRNSERTSAARRVVDRGLDLPPVDLAAGVAAVESS